MTFFPVKNRLLFSEELIFVEIIVIIIIILIIGGLYLYKTSVKEKVGQVNQSTTVNPTTSNSDSTTDIETDLNNTNIDNIDKAI